MRVVKGKNGQAVDLETVAWMRYEPRALGGPSAILYFRWEAAPASVPCTERGYAAIQAAWMRGSTSDVVYLDNPEFNDPGFEQVIGGRP